MQQEEALQRVRGRATLVLDTTYCSPQYLFPPQLQVSACRQRLSVERTAPVYPALLSRQHLLLAVLWREKPLRIAAHGGKETCTWSAGCAAWPWG